MKTKNIILLALIVASAANPSALADPRRSQRLNTGAVPEGLNTSDWANIRQQAYLKASNPGAIDVFGWAMAVSGDTVVISAYAEDSSATGVNGDQTNNSASFAGAAYVFVRSGTNWAQQAYLKASNTGANDHFGFSVAMSGDTIVVGAGGEASNATGVNGDQTDNSAADSGAAYIFVRSGTNWAQQAYLKPSNTGANDRFGDSVSISEDTVMVGAFNEDSNATGVNGDQTDNSAPNSGAAYIFVRSGTNWTQQAYLKASNTGADDSFGWSVAVSDDTAIVGARQEDSSATGVNGDGSNNNLPDSGAAYVFARTGTSWTQQAYLKASNTGSGDSFGGAPNLAAGAAVAVLGDTVVVGAPREDSSATGVNGDENNNNLPDSGAAYVFLRNGANWTQEAYLKASNTGFEDFFGKSVALSGDAVLVSAAREDSNATGVNGDGSNDNLPDSGAVYLFTRSGTNWVQHAYLKASNPDPDDRFGFGVAMSRDTILICALYERSNATGVNGDQFDNSVERAGAAYVFTDWGISPRLVLVPDGSGGCFIRFDGIPGRVYWLERATSVEGPWPTIDSQIAPASGMVEYHDSNLPTAQAFYRVAVEATVE